MAICQQCKWPLGQCKCHGEAAPLPLVRFQPDRNTVSQLKATLGDDQWVSEEALMTVPHWDKETVRLSLILGSLLGAFRWQMIDGVKHYITTHK